MGWYGTPGATKQDIIDEILEGWRTEKILREHSIASEKGETVLWAVLKGKTTDGKSFQIIACHIISCAQGTWGYKPLDETMGPYYYSVPKAWLKLYPCVLPEGKIGFSDSWRQNVCEHTHAKAV